MLIPSRLIDLKNCLIPGLFLLAYAIISPLSASDESAQPGSSPEELQHLFAAECSSGQASPQGSKATPVELEVARSGDSSVKQLSEVLRNSPDECLRCAAARALREIGRASSAAIPDLIAATKDPSPVVRLQAARSLAKIDPMSIPAAVDVMTAGLKNESPAERVLAAQALGEIGHAAAAAIPALKEATHDTDTIVQSAATTALAKCAAPVTQKKDQIFLMGIGMLRLNWARVHGNEIRFRYSDLGLPAEFSTRERASFVLDGTLGHGAYDLDGHIDYDPENRITEPPLDFLVTVGNKREYASVGDFRMGVYLDSVFSQYYHPFRGAILGKRWDTFGAEVLGGMARGESGIDELPADAGAGPYYIKDSPILRGSEIVFLVTRSALNPSQEISRRQVSRNTDYFFDYDRGEILFNYPIYSQDERGNPISILVSYQFESLAGRFTRYVLGFRTFVSPAKYLKASFTYIADADSTLSFDEAFKNRRGISTLGLNIDTTRLNFVGEYSSSAEPSIARQNGLFGAGRFSFKDSLKLYVNSWNVDTDFSTFANQQLQYGFNLYQVFPYYSERNIFISPFQFSRNLGSDLYPFTQSRVVVDQKEVNSFLEWDRGQTRFSGGYGFTRELSTDTGLDTAYFSVFRNDVATKYWGKFQFDSGSDPMRDIQDAREKEVLLGVRQRLWKRTSGDLFLQADYNLDQYDNLLSGSSNTRAQTFSLSTEYLIGQEGYFAGYRKELVTDTDTSRSLADNDILEAGVKHHLYKGIFIDSRIRDESNTQGDVTSDAQIISIGGGYEGKSFRGIGRYEIQLNKSEGAEGRRRLWSVYLFGSPVKEMDLSLRYYKQAGRNEAPTSLTETAEEELNFRLLWRITRKYSVYSQWRYDTNVEVYPPLNRTKSNSVASVQGVSLKFTRKLDFLANYKLIKVYGPIDNRKESGTAELGYLVFTHFRFGVGAEIIDYRDQQDPTQNYKSKVGYFKFVALF